MSRVLFIITQSEMGGAQRFLLEFAPYLASRGHEVAIAAGEGDGELFSKIRSTKHEIRNKFKIYKIQNLIRKLNPLKDFLALLSIFKIIKKEKPDVLFLQSTKAGFLGAIAAKLAKLLTTHYSLLTIYRIGGWSFRDPRPAWMNKILFWMEKLSAPLKDKIIVNAESDRQIAAETGIAPPEKIVKIYNGIDVTKLEFLSKEEALIKITKHKSQITPNQLLRSGTGQANKSQNTNPKSQTLLVGTIANLYATKGIEYLVEAAHILNQSINSWGQPLAYVAERGAVLYPAERSNGRTVPTHKLLFVVIGEGPERPKLEALIKKYNLEKTFFLLGSLPDARKYLRAFDVFVLPSVKEGFPWVLLEAMAAELPVIATKVGAVPEIIEDGKEGLLAPPKNSKVLAEKISEITHKLDDRFVYGKNAKKKLEQFSLQSMLGESYLTILNF